MPFLCPECSTSKSLMITSKLELPPDNRSDEITLQVVECSGCGFAGIAVYEESRRGSFDSDSFDHAGYRVRSKDLEALRKTIRACPSPTNGRCKCAAHRKLGRQNTSGRWTGLDDIHLEGSFWMRL